MIDFALRYFLYTCLASVLRHPIARCARGAERIIPEKGLTPSPNLDVMRNAALKKATKIQPCRRTARILLCPHFVALGFLQHELPDVHIQNSPCTWRWGLSITILALCNCWMIDSLKEICTLHHAEIQSGYIVRILHDHHDRSADRELESARV
jgi:hypothetical protein